MKPFHRRLLWSSTALTGATGLVYFAVDRMMQPVDTWAVINHPLQPWVLKAHILVAPVMVLAIGMIATDHIWKHYRGGMKRGRRTGRMAMWVLGPMIVSGYLIQAITHSTVLAIVAWAHIGTGLAFLAGFGAHQWVLARRPLTRRVVAGAVQRSAVRHAREGGTLPGLTAATGRAAEARAAGRSGPGADESATT